MIIAEENELRRKLESEYQERQKQPLWTTEQFAYWHAVVDHIYRGYPVRRSDIPPQDWMQMCQFTERLLGDLQHKQMWNMSAQWTSEKQQLFRQLCMREVLEAYGTERRLDVAIKQTVRADDGTWWSQITGGWWPHMATSVGLAFIQLAAINQQHRWTLLCRALKEVYKQYNTTSETDQTITSGSTRMAMPNPTPTENAYIDNPVITSWIESWVQTESQCSVDSPTVEDLNNESQHAIDWTDSLEEIFQHCDWQSPPSSLDLFDQLTTEHDTIGTTRIDHANSDSQQEA